VEVGPACLGAVIEEEALVIAHGALPGDVSAIKAAGAHVGNTSDGGNTIGALAAGGSKDPHLLVVGQFSVFRRDVLLLAFDGLAQEIDAAHIKDAKGVCVRAPRGGQALFAARFVKGVDRVYGTVAVVPQTVPTDGEDGGELSKIGVALAQRIQANVVALREKGSVFAVAVAQTIRAVGNIDGGVKEAFGS